MTELIGPLLVRLRADLRESQAVIAERVNGVSGATLTRWDISRYERGERIPDVHLPAIAVALEADLRELEMACEAARSARRGLLAASPQKAAPIGTPCPYCEGDDAMKRRELLRLGLLSVLTGTPNDLVRHSLDHVLGAAEGFSAEDWELACMDHAHSVLTQPPSQTHQALLLDIAAVRHQLGHCTPAQEPELQRIAARLSVLSGNVLTRIGDYDAARRWWSTARHAADASGDNALSARVRGIEAAFGLYAPRPLESVIALTDTARRMAGNRPSVGLLCAGGAQAQAFATLGRADDAHQVLRELTDAVAHHPDGQGYGWTPDSLAYVTSWVHAYTGTEDDGAVARAEVVRVSRSYQNIANARLHEAIAVARNGGHKAAFTRASEIVAALEPPYRTRMIVRTAQRVLEAAPIEQHRGSAAQEFKVLLHSEPYALESGNQ